MKKGILIVIEGIDGAGKSTQAQSLLRKLRLRGFAAVYFREPSRGKWGRELRRKAREKGSLTPEQELGLFLKDREENVARNLRPALRAKKIVVLDRYYFSTMAYQGAKGISLDRIRRLNLAFAPKPDVVFILDIDPASGLSRIVGRHRHDALFEREAYLRSVRRIFRSFKGPNIIHIDARQDRRVIGRLIFEKSLALLGRF
jgi:dTMP kinase